MDKRKWLAEIDDERELLYLNLCGTHDSVTQFAQFSHFSKCQNMNIYEQLCLGVRALDIRVESKNGRLKAVHGIAKTFNTANRLGAQMDLSDVLVHCYRFLDENKSETIVFQFKNDSGKENERCFDILFNTYIKPDMSRWFLQNRSPKLGEARSKIVLIRRCKMRDDKNYTDKNTGIDFSRWLEQDEITPKPLPLQTKENGGMTFIIQDRYNYKPQQRWDECIKPFLDNAQSLSAKGEYLISYLSTAGGLKGPFNNSQIINPLFQKYPLEKGKYYGIIYTDFPTDELTEKIIETNFKKDCENESD